MSSVMTKGGFGSSELCYRKEIDVFLCQIQNGIISKQLCDTDITVAAWIIIKP